VEKLIVSKPTMTALTAEDAHFTSAPTLSDLPLNIDNNSSKKVLTQLYPETSFCNECSAGTFNPITNHVAHSTDDGDDNHHHECRQLVDLSALRHDILQTFTLFSTFLTNLQQAQPATTPIPDPTDDDVYPLQPENCCQPVDLLALQQEIRQHIMASAQTFFDSLLLSVNDTLCSNNDNSRNGRQHSEPSSYDVMTADHMAHHTHEPSTLQEYLSYLHTAECFIPTRLLHRRTLCGFYTMGVSTQQFMQSLDTHSQCHHTCCNTSTIIPKHMPKPSFANLSTNTHGCPWSMHYQNNSIAHRTNSTQPTLF